MIENPAILALTAYKIAQYIFKEKGKITQLERMIGFK
jgi:hypothetical protein